MSMRDAGILLSIPIDRKSLDIATSEALAAIEGRGQRVIFGCANPHSLVMAQADSAFRSALCRATLVVADGVGLTIMAKLAGVRLGPRITGTDYFFALMNALQRRGGGRVFFFGSSQRVLDLITERFASDFPSLALCGTLSPPFGSWSVQDNTKMIQKINAACPDVLWVGMTAPKQEKWVGENRDRLDVPVIGSIGAVFDFYAGTYPRAPQWLCRTGMEWAYRMVWEPRRMWQRNLISTPRFIALVLWHHLIRARI